jgi:hypothetical protein
MSWTGGRGRSAQEREEIEALLRPLAANERPLTANEEARAVALLRQWRRRAMREAFWTGCLSVVDPSVLWRRSPSATRPDAGFGFGFPLACLSAPLGEAPGYGIGQSFRFAGTTLRAGMRDAALECGALPDDPILALIEVPGPLPPVEALRQLKERWPGAEGRAMELAEERSHAILAQRARLTDAA